jgi:hypothetical protein
MCLFGEEVFLAQIALLALHPGEQVFLALLALLALHSGEEVVLALLALLALRFGEQVSLALLALRFGQQVFLPPPPSHPPTLSMHNMELFVLSYMGDGPYARPHNLRLQINQPNCTISSLVCPIFLRLATLALTVLNFK